MSGFGPIGGNGGDGTGTGAAGGDLTGNYPNPTIANAAVTSGKLASGAAATNLGSAGGDLTGTYPNPTVASSARAPRVTPATLTTGGSNQGTATPVTAKYNLLAGGSGGVRMPPATGSGDMYFFYNNLGGPTNFYPATGESFARGGGANAACSIAGYGLIIAVDSSTGVWDVFVAPVQRTGGLGAILDFSGGLTMSGGLNLTTGTLTASGGSELSGNVRFTPQATATPSGTTQTINWNSGSIATVDLGSTTGTTTITLTNPVAGGIYRLKIIGKTGRAATLSPAPKTAGGTPITWTATNGAIDVATFLYDGSNYLLLSLVQNLS